MAAIIPAGAGWITPEQQLERLIEPIRAEVAGAGVLPVVLAPIVAEYAANTNWYKALERLNMLPDQIPPLPWHIHLILGQFCPIRTVNGERKEDGTRYRVSDTHSLCLIPAGTLNELEARVSAYGQAHLAEYGGQNPLRLSYFWNAVRLEHGATRFDEPQWILIHDVLERSRHKPYSEQAQMIAELSAKICIDYEVPSLKAAIGYVFLKAVMGERVLQAGNKQNQNRATYTRVQETTQGYRLAVGGFDPGGLRVSSFFDEDYIGVAALRKF